jgi:AcrR family transcriptional regulator
MLAQADGRPDALTAFKMARSWFKAGRRIEMQELAAELDVNRATLFRWVGGRDDLLAEVLWSLAEPTLALAVKSADGQRGARRIATIMGEFATLLDSSEFYRSFLTREPDRALRTLTTRKSPVQARTVAAVEALLVEEIDRGELRPPLPTHDLAYLLVRILQTFLYADILTGETPDPTKVEQATAALLGSRPGS